MTPITTLNDTITSEANPGEVYPARPALTVRAEAGRRLYAYISAKGLPSGRGAVVTSAVLRLYPTSDFAVTTISARVPSASWNPSTRKWNGQPSVGGVVSSVTAAGVEAQPFDIDLTSLVQGWVSGTTPNRGIRLETDAVTASFHSVNASGTKAQYRPVLLLEVAYAPEKPVDIVPSGGSIVSTPDPVITWRYGGDGVAPMAAYQVLTFAADPEATPLGFAERFASFNVNGIGSAPVPFPTRVPGIVSTMLGSGASVIGAQEANSTSSPDQPGAVVAGLNSQPGSSGQWAAFIGPNLNVIFVDQAVFTPLSTKTMDKALGEGKYASALRLQHVESGVEVIFWTTHYLTSGYLTEQIRATRILTAWLASLRATYAVPLIGSGDFNAKDRSASRPMGMFALAGHTDVRDLVETVENGTYNSHDSYEPNGMNGWWIDHLLVHGGASPTAVGLVDSGDYSDHNLVWADVTSGVPAVTAVGTPTSDSGWVPSTTPQHVLTGITGETAFVIRHKSADGMESPYSDLQHLGYEPKEALTITSTETVTDDPSPTTTWDFAGTQTAFRVLYTDLDGRTLADSGQQAGEDNQWSPEAPLAAQPGTQVLRVVRVWDNLPRVTTPGDPAYIEAVSEPFTIDANGILAPVTDLAVSNPLGPLVVLTWSRATPDRWLIDRRIDGGPWQTFTAEPGDVTLGGGLHRWHDVTAPADRDLEYQVRPVVEGSMGEGVVTSPIRLRRDFIWLADPDDPDWLLPVAGNDAGTWALGEDSAIVSVAGSDRAILIHEGFRGYEGSISGRFVGDVPAMGGGSVYAQRDAAWRLKEQPTKVWRLAVADLNIPVVVRNVTPVPVPGTVPPTYGFSLEFYQQGELAWGDAA